MPKNTNSETISVVARGKLMQFDFRGLVHCVIILVMFLGLLVAASNLPVLTHCQYYGECSPTQGDLAGKRQIGADPARN